MGTDGRLNPTNWIEVIFNPSFPYRLCHMIIAAYLSTAFMIGGVSAYFLWFKRHIPQARIMLGMATLMATFVAPLQLVVGDLHGINTLQHQPAKVAAMEGIWETEKGAALRLIGWPDKDAEVTKYAIEIPKLASLILTHSLDGEVKGLKEWPKEDRPPVAIVFWSFRIMVGIGLLMIAIGAVSAIQYYRGKLFTAKWLHGWWIAMIPSGFIALLAGWFVTEVGRQPYIAYGILRTSETVSPGIIGPQIAWSLLTFVIMYSFIFGAGSYYIIKLIRHGISPVDENDKYYQHGIHTSLIEQMPQTGGDHV